MNNYVRKIASEYNIPINKITIKDKAKIDDKHINDFLFILKFNDSTFYTPF